MHSRRKPLDSILVKPSGPDCNMRCEYCFYLEKEKLYPESKTHRMSESVLEEMIKQVMQQSGVSRFLSDGREANQHSWDWISLKKRYSLKKFTGREKPLGTDFKQTGF